MPTQLSLIPNFSQTTEKARPFLKWAGGKTQLLPQFRKLYPAELKDGRLTKYVDPFLGGGAVFFDVAQSFPIQRAFLYDINEELILIYKVVQREVEALIVKLKQFSDQYYQLDDEQRSVFYYQVRSKLNAQRAEIDFNSFSVKWIDRAAMMLFLNRTCFNGLFRLNKKGEFNVPFGKYKRPKILDIDNLLNASRILQLAEIHQGDFEESLEVIDSKTFVYFDPPYKPISKTSSFTSYSKDSFDDNDQIRLANFFRYLDKTTGAKLMLSNSDPTNIDPSNRFFEEIYEGFHIHHVFANRMINSVAQKRGPIRELVVTNYQVEHLNGQ